MAGLLRANALLGFGSGRRPTNSFLESLPAGPTAGPLSKHALRVCRTLRFKSSHPYDFTATLYITSQFNCTSQILYGWGGRIRTCACGDQNPVPYRLATPHLYGIGSILAHYFLQIFLQRRFIQLFAINNFKYPGSYNYD